MSNPREPNTSEEAAREPNTEFNREPNTTSADDADSEPNTEGFREPNTET